GGGEGALGRCGEEPKGGGRFRPGGVGLQRSRSGTRGRERTFVPIGGAGKMKYGAILADPPWRFATWNKPVAVPRGRSKGTKVSSAVHYATMPTEEIAAMPIAELAADDCVLFLWATWPLLLDALDVIRRWRFEYKTAAFVWMK